MKLGNWLIVCTAVALGGCCFRPESPVRYAVDLGTLDTYIHGERSEDGRVVRNGAGLAKTFRALSAMGYEGVIFDGYYGNDAKTLKSMLSDSRLKVLASRVGPDDLRSEKLAATCEFNLNFGNNLLLCDDLTVSDAAAGHGCEVARWSPSEYGTMRKGRDTWRVLACNCPTNGLNQVLSAIRAAESE